MTSYACLLSAVIAVILNDDHSMENVFRCRHVLQISNFHMYTTSSHLLCKEYA